jgi:hypothetical protein
MARALQTHSYDGRWKERKRLIFEADDEAFQGSPETKIPDEFVEFVAEFSLPEHKVAAARFLQAIRDPAANADPANDVNATEIAARVWRLLKSRDPRQAAFSEESARKLYSPPDSCEDAMAFAARSFKSLAESLCEQIADIQNGPCVQGRTTRLFQILSSFYE